MTNPSALVTNRAIPSLNKTHERYESSISYADGGAYIDTGLIYLYNVLHHIDVVVKRRSTWAVIGQALLPLTLYQL